MRVSCIHLLKISSDGNFREYNFQHLCKIKLLFCFFFFFFFFLGGGGGAKMYVSFSPNFKEKFPIQGTKINDLHFVTS